MAKISKGIILITEPGEEVTREQWNTFFYGRDLKKALSLADDLYLLLANLIGDKNARCTKCANLMVQLYEYLEESKTTYRDKKKKCELLEDYAEWVN